MRSMALLADSAPPDNQCLSRVIEFVTLATSARSDLSSRAP
jgi:hypothetical protein